MKRFMKRAIAFVAAFYPRSWREEFGEEFDALLDDVNPRWRVLTNVLGGAIRMQMTNGTSWLKLMAATAILGAIVAGGMSYRAAPNYVSSAVVSVTPQADPVRPTSPEVLRERAAADAAHLETTILSRFNLSQIIQEPSLDLYKEARRRTPLEDVIEQMRQDIRIQARSSTDGGPMILSISFSYPDRVKAKAVVRKLANNFSERSAEIDRFRIDMYRGYWRDLSAGNHARPAPPPPVGEIVKVLDSAGQPIESGPNRIAFLAWGLGAGLSFGLLAALTMRWPRAVWQLCKLALAGFILAAAASYLIPDRYTSAAEMAISGAWITEDPFAPLPAAIPADEFLRQVEPGILNFQTLSEIIEDPRLNLYSRERAKKSMEEVVRNMIANDIRISAVKASVSNGPASAFTISFSYSDKYKAQQVVQSLMNQFDVMNQNKQKADAEASRSVALHLITQRKAGEVLYVLDLASLPTHPVKPNRLVIALSGLVAGLLLGAIRLWRGRPHDPPTHPELQSILDCPS